MQEKAIVIGGSITCLLAARVLSDYFKEHLQRSQKKVRKKESCKTMTETKYQLLVALNEKQNRKKRV